MTQSLISRSPKNMFKQWINSSGPFPYLNQNKDNFMAGLWLILSFMAQHFEVHFWASTTATSRTTRRSMSKVSCSRTRAGTEYSTTPSETCRRARNSISTIMEDSPTSTPLTISSDINLHILSINCYINYILLVHHLLQYFQEPELNLCLWANYWVRFL